MSVLSPLFVKRFDKTPSISINHTHLIHILHFSFCELFVVFIKIFFSQTENLEPPNLHQSSSMASSSSKQISESRSSSLQIKPKTMAIPSDSFEVQSESPVDFASLRRNRLNMEPLISVQEMFPYFDMLNGPTYVTLVKDFWARAEVYDLEAALSEEDDW